MKQANLARLKQCMRRAQDGEELTIGFLGGSITQGSLASAPDRCYAYQVFSWWEQTFPNAEFHYVNGGIGGTTSHYGVSRAVTDVLMYQPDVVVVDFSVNDEPDAFFQETYEGVLRRTFGWKSKPAVLILHNVFYDSGKNAEEWHNKTASWYRIPYVSIRDTIYQKMRDGLYTREELTPDGLHPNDKGHRMVAEEIIRFLEYVRLHSHEQEEDVPMPSPMTGNAYEFAQRLTIREICPELSGFCADTEEKMGHLDHFKNGWIGKKAGDGILFEVEASCIAVQYRKTIARPALRAELVLDGDKEHKILLDGNFDEDWGDCLHLLPVLHHGERKKHTVEIRIPDEEDQGKTPFYLMALIVA